MSFPRNPSINLNNTSMREETIQKMQEQSHKMFGYALHENDYREPWLIFRIMAEFVEGYQFLSDLKNEVTILGSARLHHDNAYCLIAADLGKLLAKGGFTVITGGGPGIMEAANRGAFDGKGPSIGLNIQLPFEQVLNPYVTKSTSFFFFFTRKVMLTSPANAFVYFPGGFGTMDELFEVVDMMDLGFMEKVPIVLVGKKFWTPLLDFLHEQGVPRGIIDEKMLNSWHLVDTAEEAYELVKDVKDKKNTSELSPSSFQSAENIDWKIFRIMAELVEGFDFVTGVRHGITILGTRSVMPGTQYYASAYELGGLCAGRGYAVITGGQFGVAEAANKGAFEHGGTSIGISTKVNGLPKVNPYLTKSIHFQFPFTRKMVVTTPTKAFVFYPGGLGTMHQLFEVLTLIQTKKIKKVPVILFDHAFWGPLHKYIKTTLVHDVDTISSEDDEIYQIVDSEESILKVIEDFEGHLAAKTIYENTGDVVTV